jgi:predicted GNAT family acetyltransferase
MGESDRVVHDPTAHRYVLLRGDREIGETVYEPADGVLTFVHTTVDPTLQERGLGTLLVTGALDDVRSRGTERVAATCPFVRRFLRDHPEYADLTARRRP